MNDEDEVKNVLSRPDIRKAFNWKDSCKIMGWYRRSLNLTKKEMAKRLGVSHQIVVWWENGTKQPSISSLVKIAELFGVTETELLHATDEVKKWMEMSKSEKGP